MAKNKIDLENGLHPYSRKAKQVHRKVLRIGKLSNQKSNTFQERHIPQIDRMTWFQLYLEEGIELLTFAQVEEAVQSYLNRFEEELKELQASRKPGRSKSSREDKLRLLHLNELEEFKNSGLTIPNLQCKNNVATLRAWDGDYNSKSHIQMIQWKVSSLSS